MDCHIKGCKKKATASFDTNKNFHPNQTELGKCISIRGTIYVCRKHFDNLDSLKAL